MKERSVGGKLMSMVGPNDEVEREAILFAVLRERTRPSEPGALARAEEDADRRLVRAEEEIALWLDEAEEEGAAILERARAEAARLRLEANEQAERARQAAHREAEEAARDRERLIRDAERRSAAVRAEASAGAAEALQNAEEAAARRRRDATEDASSMLAEARAAAEKRMRAVEREAEWLRTSAEAEAKAVAQQARATVLSLQSDVGALQDQLHRLVDHAMVLLPALDSAAQALSEVGGPSAMAAVSARREEIDAAPRQAIEVAVDQTDDAAIEATSADADTQIFDRHGDAEPAEEDRPSHAHGDERALGRLIQVEPPGSDLEDESARTERRGLGRLLRRS